nr:hypothetical protein [Tanacetum cinerariifolium]
MSEGVQTPGSEISILLAVGTPFTGSGNLYFQWELSPGSGNALIEQSVNAQLEAEVLTRSSHSSRTSYAVAADLSEMELKKILIEKMEGNKSIQRSDEQRNLYKALVDAYEADKTILDSYGDTVILKRRREDDDDQEEGPSVGSDRGYKRRREEKPVQTISQMDEPSYPVFETGADDQTIVQSSQHPEWFSQLKKPPTPDHDWNKTLLAPLPLILDNRGRRVIPFAHFINNDLEYLRGGASSRKYTTSVTKTKAADYRNIKWIEDLVPRSMWIQEPINYDKHAFWGVSYWGRKRQQFYGFAVNRESALDVYSKKRIIAVTDLKIVEWHSYKHLDWITPDTYRSDLKRTEAYIAYSNPRGFIYQNKDKKNRLMRIDELHKFSYEMLNDVRNALDDRLKGIRM